MKELDLLSDSDSYLILGDPGSGKTTTLKRLARHLLHQEQRSTNDIFNFPIVVRARDLSKGRTLSEAISAVVGVKYDYRTKAQAQALYADVMQQNNAKAGHYVGAKKLEDVLVEFLAMSKAVLFVDGIDEVAKSRTALIEHELSDLSMRSGVKVIATCRSGDFTRQIESFHVVELSSLAPREIGEIINLWAAEPDAFRAALDRCPYADLADRPLFLTQLIFVFDASGYLPHKPSEVYRRITTLMLERWDGERGVRRESRYSSFDADQKLEFLAALAFHLTYRTKQKVFMLSDLIAAYRSLCSAFLLPEKEAENVAVEIESHTGIIVRASGESFEFCHLSLQEYLAAYHLVREPFSEKVIRYIREYPAPVAVAISLSSNATGWFTALFLPRSGIAHSGVISEDAANAILARIVLERPTFIVDVGLGLAFLKFVSNTDYNPSGRIVEHFINRQVVQEFLAVDAVKKSVVLAEDHFDISVGPSPTWPQKPAMYEFVAKPASKVLLQDLWMPLRFNVDPDNYTPLTPAREVRKVGRTWFS